MKKLSILLCAFVFLFGIVGTTNAARQIETSDLLQFTAAGHILGFETKGVYVASGDHMLRVEFAGSSMVSPVADQMPSENGQSQPLGRVTYPDLWPRISLSYEHAGGGIVESTYRLEPGADVSQIQLRYNAPVEIESGGSLRINYETGQMRESAPVAWQDINGQRISVEIIFCLPDFPVRNPVVGFALGQYNPAYPLMIDPVLQWNTFMGSSDYDIARAIAVDGNGNVYVAGRSDATWGSPVNAHGGFEDAFAAKLNSSGVLQWNTFMGGAGENYASAIAVDGSGNVYVGGYSNATWGSPVNAHGGFEDGFAAKLNSSGVLQWNTFMGSSDYDYAHALTVDGSGNVYVAGSSWVTWGSPVNAHSGGVENGDGFAAKLNNSGVLQWNTFMGSSDYDYGRGIAVDGSGNVYVAGRSSNTWGSPVNAHSGGVENGDGFAAKLNSSGVLQWNTFMGSSDYDIARAIAVDGNGNVYVAGRSDATWGSPVNAHGGFKDAFAAKLNSSGVLQWNTFMGSSSYDYGRAITVDGSGNVYVAGRSDATWGSPVNAHGGFEDAFAAKLNSSGVLQWNTFMGSTNFDEAFAIAVDGSGNVYVAGESGSTWGLPVTPHAGSEDAFAAKLGAIDYTITATAGENGSISPSGPVLVGDGLIATFTITPNQGYYVSNVDVDGTSIGSVTSYTFYNVTSDHTIDVTFDENPETFETGDFSQQPWRTGGDGSWDIQSSTVYNGSFAAQAPVSIGDDQSSNLSVTLCTEVEMDISFWFKVSSEYYYDFLIFEIDGVEIDRWSGEIDWTHASYPVTIGQHTFTWIYSKDENTSKGSDTVWIDDINFPKAQPCPIPTISEWGMVLFFILLVGSALWVMRRRTSQESA